MNIACRLCKVVDQWIYSGILGNDSDVMECANCSHIEYYDKYQIYLNEDGKPINVEKEKLL